MTNDYLSPLQLAKIKIRLKIPYLTTAEDAFADDLLASGLSFEDVIARILADRLRQSEQP